jgi:hypothetical protein
MFGGGGLSMVWGIATLAIVIALVGWTAALNARPARCALCHRVNIFRRSRTGERRDERDDEGDLRRAFTRFRCGLCGGCYWIVWDDFAGTSATAALPLKSDAEPPSAADRRGT